MTPADNLTVADTLDRAADYKELLRRLWVDDLSWRERYYGDADLAREINAALGLRDAGTGTVEPIRELREKGP